MPADGRSITDPLPVSAITGIDADDKNPLAHGAPAAAAARTGSFMRNVEP